MLTPSNQRPLTCVLAVSIVLGSIGFVSSQEPDGAEAKMVAAAREHAESEARRLAFRLGEDGPELKWRTKPVLHWANPVAGKLFGEVYVWTHEGRPEVICSIYKWFDPFTHARIELQSLSEGPVRGAFDGETQWSPREPGVSFRPLPNAPKPAANETGRLLQMRRMAKRFTAEAVDRDDENSTWNLRLLGQPLLRYASPKRDLVDGALFAFVQDTTSDPEVLLLIELQRTANGGDLWRYGFCRQDSLRIRASCDGVRVFDLPQLAPPWKNTRDPRNPYIVLVGSDDE